MAEGILGLGSGQAASLNQELIDKLKNAETAALITPIETDIEEIEGERETFTNIETLVDNLISSIEPFDLYVSGGVTAFEEKSASTSGDSVVFDAADVSALNTGITTVNINTLAQKDVYQSDSFTEAQKDSLGDIGILTIEVNGTSHDFDTASYSNYDDLATAIDNKTGINAAVEQVGSDSYRLVLKSAESGLDNALTISGTASDDLGFDDGANHILTAIDMKAFVDGVEYNVSSNELTVDGLSIAAVSTGESSINVVQDTTNLATSMQEFVDNFNLLTGTIDSEIANAESTLEDKSAMRTIVSDLKEKLFGTYGTNDDKSIFNFGFSLTEDGLITLDTTEFNSAVSDDLSGLKDLFIGTAEDEGLGTELKALVDEMTFSGGVLDTYEDSIDSREENLEEELETAQEDLDAKYEALASQFAAYSAIITSYENSFSGLEAIINAEYSS
jgi:flagellar hook-associated protein 2